MTDIQMDLSRWFGSFTLDLRSFDRGELLICLHTNYEHRLHAAVYEEGGEIPVKTAILSKCRNIGPGPGPSHSPYQFRSSLFAL